MSQLASPADLLVERILAACGPGRSVHIGPGADAAVAACRRRALRADDWTSLWRPGDPFPAEADADFGRRPQRIPLVCVYGALDGLAGDVRSRAFDALLRASARVLVVVHDRPRDQAEREFLAHACRKHPLHQILAPYEGLDWSRDPAVLLFEAVPPTAPAQSVAELAAARDLHMDMLREGGRRADAHVARYMLARQFVRPGDRVLDAACGLGYGSAILADGTLAEQVTGLDADAWAIAYAAGHYGPGRPRVRFMTRDVAALAEWSPASFDTIVSFETIEHVEDPDRFLADCRRLLTPGGRFVCSAPNRWVDASGVDPNPYHLHVFDRATLEARCRTHFFIERVFGQTAGGGMKLPQADRALWPAEGVDRDAEWWLLVGMTSPWSAGDVPFRGGSLDPEPDDRTPVLGFARDYEHPWLARAMVTIGLRASSAALLAELAAGTIERAGAESADAGAALCVQVYRGVERGDPPDEALLDTLRRYQRLDAASPHVRRWQISLHYAEALAWLQAGQPDRAAPALEACALADALAFSPLLATKTVGAALLRGWLAVQRAEVQDARRWFHTGIEAAERALHRPWDEFLLSRSRPALFGLREATLVVDLASRCAAGLHFLPELADRPGIFAAQLFDSPAGAAERQAARLRQLEDELAEARVGAGAWRSHAERLTADARAALLLHDTGPIPADLRVAIFGAGAGGRRALDLLRARGAMVACVADNDRGRHGATLDGVPVVPPQTLAVQPVDVIAVASRPGRAAIFAQLEELGYRAGRDFASLV